jgi:hypothetical protein
MQEEATAESMSAADTKLRHTPPVIAWLIALSWALHVAAIALFDWTHASLMVQVIIAVGVLGLLSALAWLLFGAPWKLACIVSSAVIVALYFVRWSLHIFSMYRVEPELGIWVAAGRVWHIIAAGTSWRAEKLNAMSAFVHLYWDVLMLPVQVVVLITLIWGLSRAGDRN